MALVERARGGCREGVDQLVAGCYPKLLRTARSLLGNVEDAQDAAQEAAVAVFEKVHQLRTPEAFGGWCNTVVRRVCSKYLRHRQLCRQRQMPFDESAAEFEGDGGDQGLETRNQLLEIIGQVGEPMTEILRLRLVLGLSVRETASALGLSEGAVKLRLYRARRKAMQYA